MTSSSGASMPRRRTSRRRPARKKRRAGSSSTSSAASALYEKNKELYGGRTLDEMRPSLRQQLLAEKRNAAMTAFVARLERELPVRYEPGYES